MLDAALRYARDQEEEHLSRLREWLHIPSISTLPAHAADVERAAQWAAGYLDWLGMDRVEVVKTQGHPIVYSEWKGLPNDSPTLLLYGHYDVQPVDPLEDWQTPPFDPQVVGQDLVGRGTADDKGQFFAMMAALETYLKTSQKLPVNVKLLLEGEEEVLSPNLSPFLQANRQMLSADAILIADQEMLTPQLPIIMYGVRGNAYFEIEVRGPAHDLHSGTFGGGVDNPFNVLVRLLAALMNEKTHRVNVPGFYDLVRPLCPEERQLISRAPIDDSTGLLLTGAPELAGEEGFTLAERISVRPTLDIHGISGGFTGEGGKTVIPAKAIAKFSTRLVPDQSPEEIINLVEKYLRSLSPPTVNLDVRVLGTARPVLIDYHAPAVRLAAKAYELGVGASPVYLRGGGSLPIIREMIDVLSNTQALSNTQELSTQELRTRPQASSTERQIPVVMIGFGLPDDNSHAPNEKLHLPNFYNGIRTVIHYLDLFKNILSFGFLFSGREYDPDNRH